jgi:hypothetical protein
MNVTKLLSGGTLRQAASAMLHSLDPAAFARDALNFTLDPWQSDLVRKMASGEAKRAITVCSRQSGKSTTAAVLAAHTAAYHPGSLTVLLAPTLRQSTELYAKSAAFLRMVPGIKLAQDSATACKLTNGSRIVSLPGEAAGIRGFSAPALVVVDEAAFVPEDGGLFDAVLPMLAVSNGSLLLLSTPNGRQGFFHDVWEDQGDDWLPIRVTWEQCPRITPAFIDEQRRINGPRYVAVEFCCEFAEATDQYFSDEDIRAVLAPSLPRLALTF